MTWGSSSKIQKVNIVSNNYSRYGTSVYNQLYNTEKNNHTSQGYSITSYSKFKNTTPREKPVSNQYNNDSKGSEGSSITNSLSTKSKIKNKYKSLITSSSRKLKNKLYDSSDSFSIFSSKSQKTVKGSLQRIGTRETADSLKLEPVVFHDTLDDINALPTEILANVLSNIQDDPITLLACLHVSKKFYQASKTVLYETPLLTSTYRVAQFVTSLRLHPENGKYVKCLDLSNLKNGVIIRDSVDPFYNNTQQQDFSDDIDANIHDERSRHNSIVLTTTNDMAPTNANNNGSPETEQRNSSPGPETLQDIAYAGWRDWRHRNDSLYSSPALNSYNMKRVVSRSSSIYSSSSVNTNALSKNRQRSTSSVSSITSSIMSSIQNTSHLSLSSSLGSPNTNSPPKTLSRINSSTSVSNQNGTLKRVKSDERNNNNSNASKWYSLRLRSRNKRNSQIIGSTKKSNMDQNRRNSSIDPLVQLNTMNMNDQSYMIGSHVSRSVTPEPIIGNNTIQDIDDIMELIPAPAKISFSLEKPYRSRHPHTNKFLLKYAPYRDLPLGYILHILQHCQNLIDINLSNLILFSDFKVTNTRKTRQISSLLLPSVKESEICTSNEDSLNVVYMTDSCKSFESYETASSLPSSATNPALKYHMRGSSISNNWITTTVTRSMDYPQPIDSQTKIREEYKRKSNKAELVRLNPSDIFEFIFNANNCNSLQNLKIESSIWCRQYMVKYFILNTFKNIGLKPDADNEQLNLSFLKSGMNRNFPWSCKGTLQDVTAIIILDEMAKLDDLAFEDVFQIKSEKFYESMLYTRDPNILEISNILPIEYGLKPETQNKMNFRLSVIKSERPTSYKISKLSSQNVSLCVRLCMDENFNRVNGPNEHLPKDPLKRIDRLTHSIIARVRELRGRELRINIGENNYLRESATH